MRHHRVVDTFLAIASKRDVRQYADRPVPDEVRRRILDAGRLSGSGKNRQDWEFVVVDAAQQELAQTVFAPHNVATARFVVAIVGPVRPFDAGRAAQNMMLAAWNDGVASCPNGVADEEAAAAICGGPVRMIISFGYAATPRDPETRSAEEWAARANRKPLDDVVRVV
jgi:nitroreductase